ncbi:MAG TPA: FTR1 family protein [Myxococcales bacterium]|nr:FTR1 family protein [Myxococcales bacterium]
MILTFTLAASVAQAEPPSQVSQLRRAVALLDYVATDYAQAVRPDGSVISEQEHQEQIGFVEEAAREVRTDAGAPGEDLAKALDALRQQVSQKAPPAQVSARAKELREQIAERFHVVLLPLHAPDLMRGQLVYTQSCAACHGADGHPNQALELATKPPDFTDREDLLPLSPQRVFSAATYGVPKTPMPAFDTGLTDEERWDVAFYVLALDRKASPRGLALARAALVPTQYRELAAVSDADLRAKLGPLSAQDADEALAALRRGPFAEEAPAAQGLARARLTVRQAVAKAHAGDKNGARELLVSAYLDHFEPHEAGLRARDATLVADIEGAFMSLRSAVDQPAGVDAGAARLDALLEKADTGDGGGGLVAFVAALAIALREGVEAALLVAAMLALLRKSGRQQDARAVHAGWISALAAGAMTWWASGMILAHLSGAHRELTEGVLQLITAALLLYASHWLLASMSAKRLVSFLSARTLAAGSSAVILGLTFIAVFREMLEVVLFFRGLLLESPGRGAAVGFGALSGLACLFVLVALFQKLGKRLKPRPLLLTCGILLCVLAVLMVGNGVRSLQVLGVLPMTVWGTFQLPVLGLYATREGLLSQAFVLVGLVASALWTATRTDRPAPAPSAIKASS